DEEHWEHGPEGDQEDIQKPACVGRRDAEEREQANDAEDEQADEDALRPGHVGSMKAVVHLYGPAGRPGRSGDGSALESGDGGRDAIFDSRVVVGAPECRSHDVSDDRAGHGVGQYRLEPVPYLDTHAAILRNDDDEDAVVPPLLAELPAVEHVDGILLD